MMSLYNNVFLNSKFSDFACLGDLSQYHLTDMQNQLSATWIKETKMHETFQVIAWSNKNSSYRFCYTLSGEFI